MVSTPKRSGCNNEVATIMKDWFVALFKGDPKFLKKTVVDFYNFVEDLESADSLYFLNRDRVDDEVVFRFRVLSSARCAPRDFDLSQGLYQCRELSCVCFSSVFTPEGMHWHFLCYMFGDYL
jgi:hypothetical protein